MMWLEAVGIKIYKKAIKVAFRFIMQVLLVSSRIGLVTNEFTVKRQDLFCHQNLFSVNR